MPKHAYNAEQALELLLRKVRQRDGALADQIQAAIDQGKDAAEIEPIGRKKTRSFRVKVPYTFEEALHVALGVLSAYFIEQPRLSNATNDEFVFAELGTARESRHVRGATAVIPGSIKQEKAITIELRTETELVAGVAGSARGAELQELARVPEDQIQAQERHLSRLVELTHFGE